MGAAVMAPLPATYRARHRPPSHGGLTVYAWLTGSLARTIYVAVGAGALTVWAVAGYEMRRARDEP